jgi:hypothetical protein
VLAVDLIWEKLSSKRYHGSTQSWETGNRICTLRDVFLQNVYAVFDAGNSGLKLDNARMSLH